MTECKDHGWYTAHRRRVEADHAAAKAERLWNATMDDVIAAIRPALVRDSEAESPLTPGEALAPLREAYPPPRLDDGIDMALLGKLCREEPEADAKREMAEMMDKLNGRDGG